MLSRLYIYFNSRLIDSEHVLPLCDSGASLRNVYKALLKYKFPSEITYEYEISKVNTIPPKHICENAIFKKQMISSYRKIIPSLYSIKYILYKLQLPIMFGMAVYENFVELDNTNYTLTDPKGSLLGHHAVLIVGYDDNDQTFWILNSHGKLFGDEGYFKLSYKYALGPNLSFDYWLLNSE